MTLCIALYYYRVQTVAYIYKPTHMQCRRIQTYTPYMVGLHFNLQNLCMRSSES